MTLAHSPEPPRAARPVVSPSYKWWVILMLWLVSFFNYADRQAISSVFPLVEKELGLSLVQLGILGSAFAWVYGLSSPLSGNIADRIRRKMAVLGGLQVWSIICGATALARTFRSEEHTSELQSRGL